MMRSLLTALVLLLATNHAAPRQSVPQDDDSLTMRFETVDLVLDPRGQALAAWQVRLVDPSGRARVVGIEGGEDPAFAEPPFHDPRALAGGALVLAAYDTSGAGPDAPTRIARLHLAVTGSAPVDFDVTVEVAASPNGPVDGATCRLVR